MLTPLNSLVPMIFVQSLSRPIAFYAKLGFDVANSFTSPGESEPSWAWLESGGASLMVTRASHPIDASQQAVIFCVYCDDVQSFWTALQASGFEDRRNRISFVPPARAISSRGSRWIRYFCVTSLTALLGYLPRRPRNRWIGFAGSVFLNDLPAPYRRRF